MTDQTPARDDLIETLLSELAGVDTHDVNLRDHSQAWEAVEKFAAALAARPAGAPTPQAAEPVTWADEVESRLNAWRQRQMNRSGDRLALDDFMGQESIDDLIDFVCAPLDAAPPQPAAAPEDAAGQGAELQRLRDGWAQAFKLALAHQESSDRMRCALERIASDAALAASSRAQQGAPVASPEPDEWTNVRAILAGQQAGRAARSDDAVGAPPVEPSRCPSGAPASPSGSPFQPPAAASTAILSATHTTQPGESLMGIAVRQLGDANRWPEIRELNCTRFPFMNAHDNYPVGTVLDMPPQGEAGEQR